MASIAEFTLPPSGFPLGRVFEDRPEATLDLDRVVPSGDTVMPYVWVRTSDGDLAAIREIFDGLPELRSAVLMKDLGDKGLFRAEWEPEYLGIMSAIERSGVTVLSATGSNDGWSSNSGHTRASSSRPSVGTARTRAFPSRSPASAESRRPRGPTTASRRNSTRR